MKALWPFIRACRSARNEKADAEKYIRDFLDGTGGDYDWDDFISIPFNDPKIEEIRQFCASTDRLFPPAQAGVWCNDDGFKAMRAIQERLRHKLDSKGIA